MLTSSRKNPPKLPDRSNWNQDPLGLVDKRPIGWRLKRRRTAEQGEKQQLQLHRKSLFKLLNVLFVCPFRVKAVFLGESRRSVPVGKYEYSITESPSHLKAVIFSISLVFSREESTILIFTLYFTLKTSVTEHITLCLIVPQDASDLLVRNNSIMSFLFYSYCMSVLELQPKIIRIQRWLDSPALHTAKNYEPSVSTTESTPWANIKWIMSDTNTHVERCTKSQTTLVLHTVSLWMKPDAQTYNIKKNFGFEFESCCNTALFQKDGPFLRVVSVTRGQCFHFPSLCGFQHSSHKRLFGGYLFWKSTSSLRIRTFLNAVQLQTSCLYDSSSLVV